MRELLIFVELLIVVNRLVILKHLNSHNHE